MNLQSTNAMIFKKVTEDKIPQINQLNSVGEKKWELEFYYNKKQPSYLFASFDNEKVIGCEGYISYNLLKDGEKILTHRSERTYVDPNYRGKKIFENLIKNCDKSAVKDQSLFCWGATSALKPFAKAGFETYVGFRSYMFFPIKEKIKNKMFCWSKFKMLNPFIIYKLIPQLVFNTSTNEL